MSITFPSSFRFGICDADLQVIGEKFTIELEGAEPTMWAEFTRKSKNGNPQIGIDRYHLWKEDVEIMQKLGIKHYRTSIAMNRILYRDGDVNTKAIAWYKQYFKALRNAGINIYATLYHWELPQYLSEQGGWKNPKTIEYLGKHAKAVAQNLGEYIEEYFVLNEPWCSSILSYYFGIHAPGEKSLKNALLAAHNLLLSLGIVYKILSSIDRKIKVSSTFNTEPAYAGSTDLKDILAAKYADGYFNRWFMDPIFLGKYPEDMVELYGKNMPKINKEDMELIKVGHKLHAFGLQYYRGQIVKYNNKSVFRFDPVIKKGGLINDLGWPVFVPPLYPEALYDVLAQIYYSYKDHGLQRIYLSENGFSQNTPWDGISGIINDDRRIHYLSEHIKQVHKAMERGIPIEAYFVWTLMDNFEWAEGYKADSAFGLIHVDRKTLKRVWKKSAYWYEKLLQTYAL